MQMSGSHTLFAAASLLPAALITAAAVLAGPWPLIALVSMTVWVLVMDRFGPGVEASAGMTAWLPFTVAMLHLLSLSATVWAVGQPQLLDGGETLALVIAMGLYAGQVTNACAHELIHRPSHMACRVGTFLYCSILNGQHVSAHMLVHHVQAGTAADPNSAPMGRGFYRYALRATVAEFVAGLRAENLRRSGKSQKLHPYLVYGCGAALAVTISFALGGFTGLLALLVISVHAQMQLLLSDYLQHYGLSRAMSETGKPEPMGPQHSWNAPQPYSSAMMMNAPRHSDHHMNPSRDFTALSLDPRVMPVLPYSIPVMGAIALVPPLWRRVMDPRARRWSQENQTVTTSTKSTTAVA